MGKNFVSLKRTLRSNTGTCRGHPNHVFVREIFLTKWAQKNGWDGRGTFLLLLRSVRLRLTKFFPIAGRRRCKILAPGIVGVVSVFLKIGSVVFGSGYVLLAFRRTDLVVHRAWITDAQLVDAVAIGQCDARTGLHDGDFSGTCCAGRWVRPSRRLGYFFRRSSWWPSAAAHSLHPAVGDGGRVPRRSKCCVAGLDGSCELSTRGVPQL